MIRECSSDDVESIFQIINDAAEAYRGVIPEDRWHDPYMPRQQLREEIARGVQFWGFEEEGELVGVMGIQDKGPVALVRHAYVRTDRRRKGIGSRLLRSLEQKTEKPLLIGTWAAARWAVDFYARHGYQLVTEDEKNSLLRQFWSIPERQVATSVVLADAKWRRACAAQR